MNNRVISLRLSYSTIAYCYLLQEKAGRVLINRPVGTIVADTVEVIIEASRRMYSLPDITSTEEAESIIKQYVDTIPGFDPVPIVNLMKGKPQQQSNPAGNKETSGPPEQVVQTAPVGPTVLIEQFKGPELSVEESIEIAAQAEEIKDEKLLLDTVTVTGPVDRKVSDGVPACPWVGIPVVVADEVKGDPLYTEALAIDELMAIAVRAVYASLGKEDWNTDRAIALVKKTYSNYKRWKERYSNEEKRA